MSIAKGIVDYKKKIMQTIPLNRNCNTDYREVKQHTEHREVHSIEYREVVAYRL